jgi:2-keto-4-pentenoate hydratase/2-oxohepta-3-ene-1,7-dioic acid hydratase in catechol pathway
VDYEGELVAVIGRRCRRVSPWEALDYVFGYTCGNDVSARSWQRGDLQWWRAKGADTFAPIGPWLVTGIDPSALELRTLLNGREVQRGNTSELIYDVAQLISHASQAMTLEPGDLVFTGTPGETGPLSPGDVVEVAVEGVGVLRNPVVQAGPAPGK